MSILQVASRQKTEVGMTESTAIDVTGQSVEDSKQDVIPGLERFRHLAKKMKTEVSSTVDTAKTTSSAQSDVKILQNQLEQYVAEIKQPRSPADQNPVQFWVNRQAAYSLLSPIAQDLISAPASQAYVERIFSVCGWLTAGRRNRLTKSLEMRVFMKLNSNLV